MSVEGDHVKALVASVVEQTNAAEQAAATLALAVVVEQQGAAVCHVLEHVRAELAALVYTVTGGGR